MSSDQHENKDKFAVVISVGYGTFKLTPEMLDILDMDDPYPTIKQLPRHDSRLVDLVKRGYGSYFDRKGNRRGLVVKYIDCRQYRIQEYDGHEWIETPDWITWESIPDSYPSLLS